MARRPNYGVEKRRKEIKKQEKKDRKDEKKRLKKEGDPDEGGEGIVDATGTAGAVSEQENDERTIDG